MSTRLLPPGPVQRFPGEMLWRLRRDPLNGLERLAREYGPVVHFKIGRQPVFLISDPALIRDVLVTSAGKFVKGRGLERARRLLGNGLLTSEGEVHRSQRRAMQPIFHRERIARYADLMVERAAAHRDRWMDGAEIDMAEDMSALTLDIVARALLGSDVSHETAEIRLALSNAMSSFSTMALPFAEWLDRLPLPPVRRFQRARARLDETVMRMIALHRQRAPESGGSSDGDLLAMLMQSDMSDVQLRDEVMTIFLAGHETTANALTWTWYLLSQNPQVEAAMRAEIDEALQGRLPGVDDVRRLPFTRSVLMESMRLFPPAWMIGRRAVDDTRLGEWQIPSGALVVMSQWIMHRDARWFERPADFVPSRWTSLEPTLPRGVYFPFGGGSRVCIGEHFSWMEGILLLAVLAQRWRVELAPGSPAVRPQPMITLRPHGGIRMRLRGRRTSDLAA